MVFGSLKYPQVLSIVSFSPLHAFDQHLDNWGSVLQEFFSCLNRCELYDGHVPMKYLLVPQIFVLPQFNGSTKSYHELRQRWKLAFSIGGKFIPFEARNPISHGPLRRTLIAKNIKHMIDF